MDIAYAFIGGRHEPCWARQVTGRSSVVLQGTRPKEFAPVPAGDSAILYLPLKTSLEGRG